MTNSNYTTAPIAAPAVGQESLAAIDDLDLTPAGLAAAPALQVDLESLVHTGNS